ncbi:MAG: GxxExxY protein [Phycisphaerales bacterium]|nr:GxxExxY protein [Phycisphaerales bacterium]
MEQNGKYAEYAHSELTHVILQSAFEVHAALGPGLLESAYEACLEHELVARGLEVRRQVELPVKYKGLQLGAGFRIDLLVNELVIIELKAVEKLLPIHDAQVLTYLKLSGKEVGLLLNFNTVSLKQGIKRLALTHSSSSSSSPLSATQRPQR